MKKLQKRTIRKLINRTVETKQVFNLKEFLKKAEVPAIPIWINGKEYIVLVDTGSDVSYLDTSVLQEIPKLLLGHQEEIVGGTGIKDRGSAVYQVEFACGDKEFKEEFTDNDFSDIFKFIEENHNVKLCGILGVRFLMKYKCILDFDKLVFYL